MGVLYWGRGRKRYTIGKKIGGGGEGDVYEINGHANKLAKLYKPFAGAAEREEKHDKLRAMLEMSLPTGVGGRILLAWPLDTLCDQNGAFCGYVMPRVRNKKALYCAVLPSERTTLFGNAYSWRLMPRLAYNLASMVETLHRLGVVIGDLNADNFLVDKEGYITLIDTDSYTITWKGRTYKCRSAMSDVLAPELQGKDLRLESSVFTKESDCFGLAVHLWQILNNGVHPFSLPPKVKASVCFNPAVVNIAGGYSVLSGGRKKNSDQPPLDMLPDYIMKLFERAFGYDARTACRPETIRKRPSAAEFVSALERLIREPVKQCRKTAKHVYLSSSRTCPWCEMEAGQTQKTVSHRNKQTLQANAAPAAGSVPVHTCLPKRSKKPLLAACVTTGLLFVLLYAEGYTAGASALLDTELPPVVGLIALTVAAGIGVTAVYFGLGDRYAHAVGGKAWAWLLGCLLVPLLSGVIGYGAAIAMRLIVPLGIICLIGWVLARL